MNQLESMILALFDPRMDDELDRLKQNEEFEIFTETTKGPNFKINRIWTKDVIEVDHVSEMEIGERPYIDDYDYPSIPDFLDEDYDEVVNLNRGVLEGFNRANFVHSWNFYIDTIYDTLKPIYPELEEKRLKRLIAMVAKYDRIDIYKYLRHKVSEELLTYKRIYVVGKNDFRRVFVEIEPIRGMSTEETKQHIYHMLDNKRIKPALNDLDNVALGWSLWQKQRAGKTYLQIIEELDDRRFQDNKQISRVLNDDYKKLYPSYDFKRKSKSSKL